MAFADLFQTVGATILVLALIGIAVLIANAVVQAIYNAFVLTVRTGTIAKLTRYWGSETVQYKTVGRYLGLWFLYERDQLRYPFGYKASLFGKTADGSSVSLSISVWITLTNLSLSDSKLEEFSEEMNKRLLEIAVSLIEQNDLLQFSKITSLYEADLAQLKANTHANGMEVSKVVLRKDFN